MNDTEILRLIKEEAANKISHILFNLTENSSVSQISSLFFYGSGCTPGQKERMKSLISQVIPCKNIHIASDLLGAAKALCGQQEGIACILGTGSSSGLYDGKTIVASTPSLGYILGDEGSGATLGKRLLSDALKKQLPDSLYQNFIKEYSITISDTLEHVYRKTTPNRYLASFTHFLSDYRNEPFVQQLLFDEFQRFFQRNILPYKRKELPVHFIGGIASAFQRELRLAADHMNLHIDKIYASPFDACQKDFSNWTTES